MERNNQKNGLVNLVVLLAAGVGSFGVARYSNSLSGQVGAVFLGIGTLIAFASWFQSRLEERERLEKLEFDELARSRGSATLFEGKDAETFPAQRSRMQFEKYFVPGFTVVVLLLQSTAAFFLWRWLAALPAVPTLQQEFVALPLFGLLFLLLFLLGRFSATVARLEKQRLVRPVASYLLLGAILSVVSAAAIAMVKAEFPKADYYTARGLVVVLILAALETLATLIFEIYRPRLKGKIERPLYDSRLVGVLAQPEGLVVTAAQTLDYQFGFKVSETWFYVMFKQAVKWMFLLQFAALLLSTCAVFIDPGEQALLERFGKPVAGREVLGPGAHLKLPWPIDKVYRFRTDQIQTLNVGFTEEEKDHDEKVVLWTVAHTKDEGNFLVASREDASGDTASKVARKAPPVSFVTVSIPVQFQIKDLLQWAYNHEDSANLLQQVASREVVRYLVSVDLNAILSTTRAESAVRLRERIQTAADELKLGAKVLFVGLQDIHPPVKVAPEYQKVVAARHKKQAAILGAEADAIRTNLLAAAAAAMITNTAEAARLDLEVSALARAAAFTNQLPAYNSAPNVYLERLRLETFARAAAPATKYLILTTNADRVVQWDLQRRISEEQINQISGAMAAPKN